MPREPGPITAPRSTNTFAAAVLIATATGIARAGDGIEVGQDGAGKLKVIIDEPFFVVPFSVFPLQTGWAFGAVGFESIDFDIPLEKIFVPDSSANMEAVLVAYDPGCRLWSPTDPMNAGDTLPLGNPFFDYHPVWQILDGPSGASFNLTFVIRDLSGLYAPSDEFTVTLTAAYCPSDFNRDGFVTGDDFDAYADAFVLGDPAADFDGDTFVTGDDFDAYALAFEAGC